MFNHIYKAWTYKVVINFSLAFLFSQTQKDWYYWAHEAKKKMTGMSLLQKSNDIKSVD